MQFGALGDIHGDFPSVRAIMGKHSAVPFWLCVGDLATDTGGYEAVESPLYWIKGNNEDFDRIAAGDFPRNLHYLPNAEPIELQGLRIAGLGGTFAPNWYDTAASDLPHPVRATAKATSRDDKR